MRVEVASGAPQAAERAQVLALEAPEAALPRGQVADRESEAWV